MWPTAFSCWRTGASCTRTGAPASTKPPSRASSPFSFQISSREMAMNEVMTQPTTKPKGGPKTLIEIDLSQSPYTNDMIHNRWHPDIPMVAWVKPDDDFIVQTYDWTGGFIKNNESADDVRDIDLSIVHFLSGP